MVPDRTRRVLPNALVDVSKRLFFDLQKCKILPKIPQKPSKYLSYRFAKRVASSLNMMAPDKIRRVLSIALFVFSPRRYLALQNPEIPPKNYENLSNSL